LWVSANNSIIVVNCLLVLTQPFDTNMLGNTSKNYYSSSTSPQLGARISQKIFTFESAKLQQVEEQPEEKNSRWLVEEISGWLGRDKKEEFPAKRVNTWQLKKITGKAKCFEEGLENGGQLEMVYIPAGTFLMGAPAGVAGSLNNEKPQHLVTVPAFYMGRYPVTQRQYLAIIGNNPADRPYPQLPVENVSWNNAQQFCQKLSARTGRKYRLPSEAEWEYACRAGTTTAFHFGEKITAEVANFDGNNARINTAQGQRQTTIVGSFLANDFGLSDMHGNVWEWCADSWHHNYEETPIDGSAALCPGRGSSERVLRGGSWSRTATVCRSASRYKYASNFHFNDIGFRVVYDFTKAS
jgi:formylglycine-generating enzyme required for sulfatase activity